MRFQETQDAFGGLEALPWLEWLFSLRSSELFLLLWRCAGTQVRPITHLSRCCLLDQVDTHKHKGGVQTQAAGSMPLLLHVQKARLACYVSS
jgi:hypothetical protein